MYPSTADLVSPSTVTELQELEGAQQDALRDEAILAIQGACKQAFVLDGDGAGSGSGGPEPTSRVLDGNGSAKLYLPRRLSSLTELSVVGGAIAAGDVGLGDLHDFLYVTPEGAGTSWASRAVAEAKGCSPEPVFPAGTGTVTVTGIWGWSDDETPEALAAALRYDMEDRALAGAHALSESVRSARALGLSGIQQGNLSVQMTGREPAISTRVRRVLTQGSLIWRTSTGSLA